MAEQFDLIHKYNHKGTAKMGKQKQPPYKRIVGFTRKGNPWNGGKKYVTERFQSNDYKDTEKAGRQIQHV